MGRRDTPLRPLAALLAAGACGAALGWGLSGCATGGRAAIEERIGGALRTRAFASPTAYEAFLRAEVAIARGDLDAADRQLDLALLADPTDPWLAARRVELRILQRRLDDALSLADEAARRHPSAAAVFLARAEVHARAGRPDASFADARHALSLEPDDPDVRAAVTALSGGDRETVARARRDAPGALARDRVIADRLLLDPRAPRRPADHARARTLAGTLRARGDWAGVDRVLGPAARMDSRDIVDRLAVIEARARDGRPRDAAAMVAGLRVSDPATEETVAPVTRARLWLLSARADVALEEADAALRARPGDPLALQVRAEALLASGNVSDALRAVASLAIDAPADPFAPAWDLGWAGEGDGPSGQGLPWARQRVLAAEALSRVGLREASELCLLRAIGQLPGQERAVARDHLRVALGSLRAHSPAGRRQALAEVETPWGRHRRAALEALDEPPAGALEDLRQRSGDPREDALADAWRVLVCALRSGPCAEGESAAALASASRDAPFAPVTLRATAALTADRREAEALVRSAHRRDPDPGWTAALLRTLRSGSASRTP